MPTIELLADIEWLKRQLAIADAEIKRLKAVLSLTEALDEHEDQCFDCKPGNNCMVFYALYGRMCEERGQILRGENDG